jgi:hypothetical protein
MMVSGCVARGVRRLCVMLCVAAAPVEPLASVADEASPEPGASNNAAAAKEILDLMFREPEFSFDTTPVRFYINGTLFAVPRNMIAHMPEHVVEGASASPDLASLSNRVTLQVMLPDMHGLTEASAECYLRGSDCEELVRVNISTNHTGSALVSRRNEANYYHLWGDTPTEIADDLAVFPLREGTGAGFRVYLGRLTPETSLNFECNVPDYIAPLCRIMTGLEPERGTVTIFFNKSRVQDWRLVYEGVQRLIAASRTEN